MFEFTDFLMKDYPPRSSVFSPHFRSFYAIFHRIERRCREDVNALQMHVYESFQGDTQEPRCCQPWVCQCTLAPEVRARSCFPLLTGTSFIRV